jgi:DNA polymerase-3 subunit alpha
MSLLAMPPIPTIEWDKSTLLAFEREMLGLYVSDHPLFGIEHILTQHADTSIAALTGDDSKPDGANVTIAGLITGLQIKRTKKGDLYAIVTVEDLDGAIDCLFFPSAYMTVSTMLGHDVVCVVRGRLNRRDETPTIFAQELTLPDIKEGPRGPVVVTLPLTRATNGVAERIKRVLAEHPGVTEVHVKLTQPGRSVLLRLDDSLRVTASPALFGDLKALLGPSCLS